jgi:F420-non-reducing hydrogenase iron-sulfur subunit
MRLIRVMCSGRIDMAHVLRAFSNGMDGVFIGGCHLNECNYITHGNYHALTMVLLMKRILEHVGMNPDRLRIQFMSGAESGLFVESVNDFVKTIKEIGPLGRGKGEGAINGGLKPRLAEITKLVPYIKVTENSKLGTRLENRDDYESFFTKEEVEGLLKQVASYYIDPEKCQACTTCARRCPADAIISAKGQVHVIEQDKCIKCGTCYEACPPRFAAIRKIVGEPVPPPPPEDHRTVIRKGKETQA